MSEEITITGKNSKLTLDEKLAFARCICMTKIPDPQHHWERCPVHVYKEVAAELQRLRDERDALLRVKDAAKETSCCGLGGCPLCIAIQQHEELL